MIEPSTVATPRFLQALTYAVTLHGCDVRKGTSIPYVTHLLGVCALVTQDGGGEVERIAALLHDSLEDHPLETSFDELSMRFGGEVAGLVQSLSDTPPGYAGTKPAWETRKNGYLEHLERAGTRTLRISLADKLDNIRSMLADLPRDDPAGADRFWDRFNAPREQQLWLYQELRRTFTDRGCSGFMMREFQARVAELEQILL